MEAADLITRIPAKVVQPEPTINLNPSPWVHRPSTISSAEGPIHLCLATPRRMRQAFGLQEPRGRRTQAAAALWPGLL